VADIDRHVGSFQERAARVFVDTHEHFSNLPIKPWRKRDWSARKYPAPAAPGGGAA
jgi:hypothetical protein